MCDRQQSTSVRKCGRRQGCPKCKNKPRPFSIRGTQNDPLNHFKVTVGPDPETIEKEVRICCCGDRIHFSGEGVIVDLQEGSALVEIIADNILCATACSELPPPSETVGQLVVCTETGQIFFSDECTNGEHIPAGSLEGLGLTCGHLIVGGEGNVSTTLAPANIGDLLHLDGEGKPAYRGLTCGHLLVGVSENRVGELAPTVAGNLLHLDEANKPAYRGLTCGHLLMGDGENNVGELVTPTDDVNHFMIYNHETGKAEWKTHDPGEMIYFDNDNVIDCLSIGNPGDVLTVQNVSGFIRPIYRSLKSLSIVNTLENVVFENSGIQDLPKVTASFRLVQVGNIITMQGFRGFQSPNQIKADTPGFDVYGQDITTLWNSGIPKPAFGRYSVICDTVHGIGLDEHAQGTAVLVFSDRIADYIIDGQLAVPTPGTTVMLYIARDTNTYGDFFNITWAAIPLVEFDSFWGPFSITYNIA